MIELPDDELDKLFRKSSEELDPQYEPDDWNALRSRLDEHDGRTVGGWLRKWWPAGLLALLIPAGILMYYLFQNTDRKEAGNGRPAIVLAEKQPAEKQQQAEKHTAPDATVTSEKAPKPEHAPAAHEKAELNAAQLKSGRPAAGNAAPATALVRKSKILPRGRSEAGGVFLEPDRSKAGGGDGALIISDIPSRKRVWDREERKKGEMEEGRNGVRDEGKRGGMEDVKRGVMGVGVEGVALDSALRVERVLVSADMLRARPLVWTMREPEVEIKPVAGQMQDSSASEQERPAVLSPKWAVRVGYSPDLTTVGFNNLTRVGKAFSLLFEYGISKKLYLQTGVVRSEKDYSAGAGEYEFYDYVTAVNTPYDVDGMCTMFEIPLGIRYDLAQKAHSRWFASSGFSSYYAQKEKYIYHYKDYVHGQKSGWQGKTGLFLFSHLNASIGYERSITRKLSILAEPYVRIPLKGVGYGKVNLLTTGAWISLRYTPVFR
ncbi:hypothetical protein [Dyadobacter sandarakinus]|uniref:Outer membrane protein beta-barrel domain-containing protein n=1 Tax=Dyadobacter sandarakinus TaxID=2747268 RepID=A0ABX7I9C3_9BACT|nr:hypothetical protein [Dyadobacter sandarakinus]QRR02534.1 hypothetical protein HWI92_17270 [Dyadobacter sandarakinus]